MFKGAKKEDLRRIASELELCVGDKLTVLDFMDLLKNCDRYKNDSDSVHELANIIIEERKYDESQQLEIKFCKSKEDLCKCCQKKHHSSLCFSGDPNFTSERVIQPSSLGAERVGNRGILDESTFSEGVCVQTHKLHREISKEESSSQGVGDLFTATSYNTIFGYIASGSIPVSSENKPHCGLIKDNVDLEKTMRRFWEIENVEPETIKNKETIIWEEHFQKKSY
ncbi:hypothetical protein TNCV_131151 [Trichonephila clavipes]|nr:hypothetical protein TNCV_131151 [Trichonephila clavipes]